MRDDAPHPLKQQAEAAAEMLGALSNPKRLMLLCMLLEQDLSVGDLAQRVGLSQSALSQHLTRMRLQGLVAARRDGQSAYYSVSNPAVRDVIATLYRHYCAPRNSAPLDRSRPLQATAHDIGSAQPDQ